MSQPRPQGELGRQLVERMAQMTADRVEGMALANAERNGPLVAGGQSIAALRDMAIGASGRAIIIAAGPSIKRRDPIKVIKETGFEGAIIATESGMPYCLRNGVIPDLVVTADPHPARIVRWFGDPNLEKNGLEDDYFRRQDMDEALAREHEVNRQMLSLMDRHGKEIRLALATTSSNDVVDRAHGIGMQIFWWNPMLDDPNGEGSVTRKLYASNRMPCVNAGGNVGTAAWMFADVVLGKTHIALTGMDFSYYGDTPYRKTQYYHEAVALVGEDGLDSVYMHVHNPFTKSDFFTDPAYMWYREAFLELAKDADGAIYNCTEGGILFGDNITFIPLREFIEKAGV